MMRFTRLAATGLVAGTLACTGPQATVQPEKPVEAQEASPTPPPAPAEAAPTTQGARRFQVPVEYHKLDNGLKVVLSRDSSAPKVAVGVYYNIGFRIEPKDRTGFAHLFEHMMFQGSKNLGKMEFVRLVQANGGVLNGSTRFDFTNYFEIVPSHALETMLWAEADRMRGLAVTQENLVNQQGVVKNEVKVNVLNQPYGGFPWLDMPQLANSNWYNAHNFYGDLEDLDAATLEDVQAFFKTYYAPNNAVVVLVGDFESQQALAWVKKYFSDLPAVPQPPQPDIREPRQEKMKRSEKVDPLAQRPAFALAYHMPPRNSPEYWAMGLLHQILLEGKDSALYQNLVQQKGLTGDVSGGTNLLGNMYNYNGPMLWTLSLFHDADKSPETLLSAIDESIEKVRTSPVDAATLERARIKARSELYGQMEGIFGFGTADLLASFALFDDDPARINRLEDELAKVTPELIQKTAQEYLRPDNRTLLVVKPKS
ncbi:pitrilysin family protein [Archangium violaceum]|uniref:M16 family metallopeptidase n=1 Tax=Archangium violaceum TaxID=83451 RepID=UPI002B2FD386|nr:pitrilysin family protein [Archangium gephyra]